MAVECEVAGAGRAERRAWLGSEEDSVCSEAADLPGPLYATMAPEIAFIQLCMSSGLSACT